jgi:hypothetical protein
VRLQPWSTGAEPGQETVVTLDLLDLGEVTEIVLTHGYLTTLELHALASVLSSLNLDS